MEVFRSTALRRRETSFKDEPDQGFSLKGSTYLVFVVMFISCFSGCTTNLFMLVVFGNLSGFIRGGPSLNTRLISA